MLYWAKLFVAMWHLLSLFLWCLISWVLALATGDNFKHLIICAEQKSLVLW